MHLFFQRRCQVCAISFSFSKRLSATPQLPAAAQEGRQKAEISTVDRSCAHLPEGLAGAAAEAKENSSCLRDTNIAAGAEAEGVASAA